MSRPPRTVRGKGPTSRLRALVTDVDGTLTDAERRLDPVAIDALRSLTRAGWPVLLATGNVLPIALALHRSLGIHGPVVAENGGILWEQRNGRDHVVRLSDRRVALRAFHHARREGLPVRALFTDRWRETEVGLEPTVSVRRLARAVRGFPVTVESTGFALHIMARGAGKRRAVERALRPLGLTLSDCVVAGDGDNDVEMLKAAGASVSFSDGSARARRAAGYVARRPHARGFVEALMRLGVYDGPVLGGVDRDARRKLRTVR
ncbi:MAG TPA: phosphoglycolate phosphatase [Thermoplasmata archaeon]|nr:phosphoglycolate phosphatase [Thermoplasmata archaeon]